MSKQVTGLEDLQKFFKGLPDKLQTSIVRGALRAGAREVALIARDRVPKKSRTLRKSIRYNTERQRKDRDKVRGYVKAGGKGKEGKFKGAFYGHMVEFGTKQHIIRARPGNAAGLFGKGIMQVNHPGSQKRPFMRPALDTADRRVLQASGAYMRKRFTKLGINTADVQPAEDLAP